MLPSCEHEIKVQCKEGKQLPMKEGQQVSSSELTRTFLSLVVMMKLTVLILLLVLNCMCSLAEQGMFPSQGKIETVEMFWDWLCIYQPSWMVNTVQLINQFDLHTYIFQTCALFVKHPLKPVAAQHIIDMQYFIFHFYRRITKQSFNKSKRSQLPPDFCKTV